METMERLLTKLEAKIRVDANSETLDVLREEMKAMLEA
jgi:hypothetical protein